jgi:3-deoxy-D-manno-octulosonate 8-phosphate phosphatase (KDO 8-P phosphatase)
MVNSDALTPPLVPLFERELRFRAANLRLVVTDVDGVLTDGGVYYSERGEALKRFSVRDGMGIERLRADGVETAFMTREASAIVARRAEKLGLRYVYLGVSDKRAALPRLLEEAGVRLAQVAYIGDDVNDTEIMNAVSRLGLVGAPRDAALSVAQVAHRWCTAPGGHGAFREFAEWLLELRREAREPGAMDTPDESSEMGASSGARLRRAELIAGGSEPSEGSEKKGGS